MITADEVLEARFRKIVPLIRIEIFMPIFVTSIDRGGPEKEILKDGVPVKRYQTFYVKNFRQDWKEFFQIYMLAAAIFEFMPNLRGYGTDITSAQSMEKLQDLHERFILLAQGERKVRLLTCGRFGRPGRAALVLLAALLAACACKEKRELPPAC